MLSSAHGRQYYVNPPAFKSETNEAVVIFVSNEDTNDAGVLMSYMLGEFSALFSVS